MSPVTSDPADLHAPASLAESLRDTIRRQIVTTVLHPGDLLLEKSLAAEFGVSKTPVREALRRLESEGLVVNQVLQELEGTWHGSAAANFQMVISDWRATATLSGLPSPRSAVCSTARPS